MLFNVFAGGFEWGAVVPETQAGDDVVIIGPGLRAMASVMAAKEAGRATSSSSAVRAIR